MRTPGKRGLVLALVAVVAAVAIGAAVGLGIINSRLIDSLVAAAPAATAGRGSTATPGPDTAGPGSTTKPGSTATPGSGATPGPSQVGPSASPAAPALALTLEMPAGADCLGCHTTAACGSASVFAQGYDGTLPAAEDE